MSIAIFTGLLTFLFMGVVANWLVQRWQHRNWLNQQCFLGKEKEYFALQELFDEISSAAGRRITRMRRLMRVLSGTDVDLIRKRLTEYDKEQMRWNDQLNPFYVRTTMFATYNLKERLEDTVQAKFVEIGHELEKGVNQRLQGTDLEHGTITKLDRGLNTLQGIIEEFSRDMLRVVLEKKKETYYGLKITLSRNTLFLFPTWNLFKALFKSRKSSISITRTAADLGEPMVSRD